MGILLLITPPGVYPDAAWGFQVWRSMQQGNGFNILTLVSQWDLSTNAQEFKSWWSPGQYLVPGMFQKLFGLDLGHASSVTIIVFQFLGLAGLYIFFKKAGFSKMISALAILVIMLQQSFLTPYIFYNGGEVLLFGFIGWFLWGCLHFNKPNIALAIFVLLAGWIGFFAKSSFLWMYAAGLIFMWIQLSRHTTHIKHWLINGFWVGIPAIISVATIYALYLSKGLNPSSASAGLDTTIKVFAFPLASPMLAGFSFDDLANGLILHNDEVIFNPIQSIIIVILLAILSIVLICAICKHVPDNRYSIMLVVFYIVSVFFFGSAFLRRLDISFEARHFRTIGLLIIPGTVFLVSHSAKAFRYGFWIIVSIGAIFCLKFYVLSYIGLRTETVNGSSGIAQQFTDRPSMDHIRKLDDDNRKALFVFFSPDLGLDINHNRYLTLDPLDASLDVNPDDYLCKGYAGPLYILMPREYLGKRADFIIKSFTGYEGFSYKALSDDYVLYTATERANN